MIELTEEERASIEFVNELREQLLEERPRPVAITFHPREPETRVIVVRDPRISA